MAEKPSLVIYVPPSDSTLEQYAYAVCQQLGQSLAASFNTPEVRYGFAEFLKVLARIQARHLSTGLDIDSPFDNKD